MVNHPRLRETLEDDLGNMRRDRGGPGDGGTVPPADKEGSTPLMERLARLEGSFDWIKVLVGLIGAVIFGGFSLLSVQLNRVDGRIDRLEGKMDAVSQRVDAISQRIADEFRAMRADTAAQTSAIANSITAAKQAAPQVILVPAPQPERQPGQ